MSTPFNSVQYVIRRKVFTFFGQKYHIYDAEGRLALFAKQKAFRLREDLRLFSDESMQTELLSIKTPQMLDFGATYHIVDSTTSQRIGSCRRHGFKSMLRDEWTILDSTGAEVGKILEDSAGMAAVRRIADILEGLGPVMQMISPQSFHVDIHGTHVCKMHQNRNPFVQKLTLDFSADPQQLIDRRLGIAAGVLINAVEGRQEGQL